MKYNVGDRVRIKSIDWYNENKDINGNVDCGFKLFTYEMSKFCGYIMTVCNRTNLGVMTMGGSASYWTDEMIEGLVEEEVVIKADDIYNEEYSKGEYCHEQSFKWGFQEGYNYSKENDKLEISLKEGYQFKDENGNVINATKIVLEKKKKEYPKTYEECSDILSVYTDRYSGYKGKLLWTFQKLLICRDAYWKIAGEEMGLGKPWQPDCNSGYFIPAIIYKSGSIQKVEVQYRNAILAFPTPEMRDAFKENFDPDIEICKELL